MQLQRRLVGLAFLATATAATAQDTGPVRQLKVHTGISMFKCKSEQSVARIQQRTAALPGADKALLDEAAAGAMKVLDCTSAAKRDGQALAKIAMDSMKTKDGKDAVVAAYGAFVAAMDGIPSSGESPAAYETRLRQLEARLNEALARLDLLD